MNSCTVAIPLLAASLIFVPSAGFAADPPTPENADPIRVGIITEENGPHLDIYLRSIALCEGVAQVAIVDASGAEFERAKRVLTPAHGDVMTYRSVQTMVEKFDPDLALITLPAYASPAAIRLALENDCHVLSEKPGCVNVEQFAGLVRRRPHEESKPDALAAKSGQRDHLTCS